MNTDTNIRPFIASSGLSRKAIRALKSLKGISKGLILTSRNADKISYGDLTEADLIEAGYEYEVLVLNRASRDLTTTPKGLRAKEFDNQASRNKVTNLEDGYITPPSKRVSERWIGSKSKSDRMVRLSGTSHEVTRVIKVRNLTRLSKRQSRNWKKVVKMAKIA